MTLLRDIRNSAVDSSVPLTSLLRKCKILAVRLGHAEFKAWVDAELNGYPPKETVPQYRMMSVNSKGAFFGPGGTRLRNVDIPLLCIPEQFRQSIREAHLRQAIASLESLVADTKGGIAQQPWPPDLVAYVGEEIYEGMNCVQAWKVIPISEVVAALDSVRTRILNFVLEIETEAPGAGEAPVDAPPVPKHKVTQIFNTHIIGNVGNIAAGGTNSNQNARLGQETDKLFADILQAVSRSQADSETIARLCETVEEMRGAEDPERFNASYQNFMSVLSDHMQVFGTVLAPYLPALSKLLS